MTHYRRITRPFSPPAACQQSSFFCVLLTLVLLTGCGDDIRLQALTPDSIILAFGDSLTYGTGAVRGKSYPDALAELTKLNVVNAGIPGEVTSQGLKRLPGELEKHRPNLIIICHGGNDIIKKLPPRQTEANLRRMIEISHASGAEVVLISVPRFSLLKSVPDYYQTIANDFAVPIESKILPELEFDTEMKSDPIHLNAVDYHRFAEALASLIKKHGAL